MVYGRIYGLHDPRTDELRYIGQTVVPLKRRRTFHCVPSHLQAPSRRASWIKSLLAQGLVPEIRGRAEAATQEELDQLERQHIEAARAAGTDLLNHHPGGHFADRSFYQQLGTTRRGHSVSSETRAKISSSKRANPSRQRVGSTPHTAEAKARIAEARRGKHNGSDHHSFRHDISTEDILKQLSQGKTKVAVAKDLGVTPTFIHRRIAQVRGSR